MTSNSNPSGPGPVRALTSRIRRLTGEGILGLIACTLVAVGWYQDSGKVAERGMDACVTRTMKKLNRDAADAAKRANPRMSQAEYNNRLQAWSYPNYTAAVERCKAGGR